MYILQEDQRESLYENADTSAIASSPYVKPLMDYVEGVIWNTQDIWEERGPDGEEDIYVLLSSSKLMNNKYRPAETTISYSIVWVPDL